MGLRDVDIIESLVRQFGDRQDEGAWSNLRPRLEEAQAASTNTASRVIALLNGALSDLRYVEPKSRYTGNIELLIKECVAQLQAVA